MQPNGNGATATEEKVVYRPFRVGVTDIDDDPYDERKTLSTGVQQLRTYDVPSTGYVNDLYILVESTVTGSTATATGTGAVGVVKEDGPFNVLNNIKFMDTGQSEIVGGITGYDLYIIDKWGGYAFQDDARSATGLYSVTSNATASSSAAGSFRFMLRVPLQLVPRDALGSLPNKSQSTPYKLHIQLAAISTVFVNSATVGGEVRVRIVPAGYWEPTPTDGDGNPVAGNPPAVNTTQFWTRNEYEVPSGKYTIPLTNSVGYPLRNLIFMQYSDDGTRATGETEWPDDFILQLQSNIVINRFKLYWAKRILEDYGYTYPASDTAGAKDNGVWALPFCRDFGPKPGWETRRGYLRTSEGMKLLAKGTWGGAGTTVVLTNYVGIGAGATLAQVTT